MKVDSDGVIHDDIDFFRDRVEGMVGDMRHCLNLYVPHDPMDYALFCDDPSLTRQEFAEEADINSIMAKYQKTGLVPGTDRQPMYGDFADLPSYMEAQEIILRADAAFSALPAEVRRRFDNDPAEFVEFASDPKNIDQMRVWGLAEPLDEPEAPESPPAAPPAPAASGEPHSKLP